MDDHTPLEPDQLDELLSAELDGELDGAARDLGMTVDEAATRLRATPGAGARRIALASARDLLGGPVELDEITAARLRGEALRGSEPHTAGTGVRVDPARRQQVWWATGIVAASLALIVALLSGVGIRGHDSKADSAPAIVAAPATTAGRAAKPVNGASPGPGLGAFADTSALAQVALGRAGAPPGVTFAQRKAALQPGTTKNSLQYGSGSGQPTSTSTDQLSVGAAKTPSAASTTAPGERTANAPESFSDAAATLCPTPNVDAVATGTVLRLRATAMLGGKPVAVWVFSAPTGYVVAIDAVSTGGKCSPVGIETTG